MHQTAENEYGSDDADWNMPGDDLLPEHVSQTEQEGECTNLTGSTGTEGIASSTEEHAHRIRQLVENRSIARLDGCLHDSQRSSTRCSISIAEHLSSHRP